MNNVTIDKVVGFGSTQEGDFAALVLEVSGDKARESQRLALGMAPDMVGRVITQLLEWGVHSAKQRNDPVGMATESEVPKPVEATWAGVATDDDGSPVLVARCGRSTVAFRLTRRDAEALAQQLKKAGGKKGAKA